jgi:glutamate-1-semialdehyde 2,1-aminomutase
MARQIDLDRVAAIRSAETERFVRERPRSMARIADARAHMPLGVPMAWMDWSFDHPPIYIESADGAYITDVDGHRYLDMYLGITVAAAGHTQPAVIDAVTERLRRGIAFGLPTDDAIAVSSELAARWGLPKWQFTLTSSQAITDVVRLARIATGRDRVLVFEGKYHGHVSELLAIVDETGTVVPEYDGITAPDVRRTRVVDWNDTAAVRRELETGDVALVIAEPALTNSGIVFPAPGFHAALRELTLAYGSMLVIDETQTLPLAFGGLTRAWGLEADAVVVGKSLGAGVPVAAYGLTVELAAPLEREAAPYEVSGTAVDEPATGGTTFGNALSMAAARAALEHVWTPTTYARTAGLASVLAGGLRTTFRAADLDWDVYELGNRAGYRPHPEPPRDNAEAGERDIPTLRHAQRAWMANRGVFEFGWWCGPAVSAQATRADIDHYLAAFAGFIRAITG